MMMMTTVMCPFRLAPPRRWQESLKKAPGCAARREGWARARVRRKKGGAATPAPPPVQSAVAPGEAKGEGEGEGEA